MNQFTSERYSDYIPFKRVLTSKYIEKNAKDEAIHENFCETLKMKFN